VCWPLLIGSWKHACIHYVNPGDDEFNADLSAETDVEIGFTPNSPNIGQAQERDG